MTKSIDYYKLLIIVPCSIILPLFLLFFFGLSTVDAAYLNINVTDISFQAYGHNANKIGPFIKDISNGFSYAYQGFTTYNDNGYLTTESNTLFATYTIDPITIQNNKHYSFILSYSSKFPLEPNFVTFASYSYPVSCSVSTLNTPTSQEPSSSAVDAYFYNCLLDFDNKSLSPFELSSFRVYFSSASYYEESYRLDLGLRERIYYYNLDDSVGAIETFKQQSHDDAVAQQNQDKKIAEEQKKRDEEMQKKQDETNSELKEQNKTSKNIFQKIIELPQTITNLFLNMLKSLFIPSEEDLNDIIDDSTKISENFGFVGQSFSFVIRLFTSFSGMVNSDGCVELPELTLKFSAIKGMSDYTMWQKQNVCMSDNPLFGKNSKHIDTIRMLLTGSLVCAYIGWAVSQINEILSKEDTSV